MSLSGQFRGGPSAFTFVCPENQFDPEHVELSGLVAIVSQFNALNQFAGLRPAFESPSIWPAWPERIRLPDTLQVESVVISMANEGAE